MPVRHAAYPTDRLEQLASFLPPVIGTLLILVFVDLLSTLGFDDRTACITGLLVAFTSIVWVYSHISFDATATGLFLLSSAAALARYERSAERRWLVVGAGTARGRDHRALRHGGARPDHVTPGARPPVA